MHDVCPSPGEKEALDLGEVATDLSDQAPDRNGVLSCLSGGSGLDSGLFLLELFSFVVLVSVDFILHVNCSAQTSIFLAKTLYCTPWPQIFRPPRWFEVRISIQEISPFPPCV